MKIGVPKEIKNHEYRVGATPSGVMELVKSGHEVFVEKDAGLAIDFTDENYIRAGAKILKSPDELYSEADMILKVKEPQESECKFIKENQIIFSYLHLAAEEKLTDFLIKSKSIAIAFETVTANDGTFPLLAPMSEVAGKLSIQAGARALEKSQGGRGVLLGGVTGVDKGIVTIIGGGVAGMCAARVAIGMGARVTILEKSLARIRYLNDVFQNTATIIYASEHNITSHVLNADLVIGAVLIPGSSAPKIVSKAIVKKMKPGSVIVDIAIDQGGCFETSRPTSHSNPTYSVDDVIHYCVTNMPAAVSRTSTQALENSTLPLTLEIANKGYKKALADNLHLLNGLNVYKGQIVCKAVAESLGKNFSDPKHSIENF